MKNPRPKLFLHFFQELLSLLKKQRQIQISGDILTMNLYLYERVWKIIGDGEIIFQIDS